MGDRIKTLNRPAYIVSDAGSTTLTSAILNNVNATIFNVPEGYKIYRVYFNCRNSNLNDFRFTIQNLENNVFIFDEIFNAPNTGYTNIYKIFNTEILTHPDNTKYGIRFSSSVDGPQVLMYNFTIELLKFNNF